MVHDAQPMVAHVLESSFLERDHKPISRFDADLVVGSAVDKQQWRCSRRNMINWRCRFITSDPRTTRSTSQELTNCRADLVVLVLVEKVDGATVTCHRLH